MRTVVRNSFARQTILAERVSYPMYPPSGTCAECGNVRQARNGRGWLYRLHVDDDSGRRHSGPIAEGRLFCSRPCAEQYLGGAFDEGKAR